MKKAIIETSRGTMTAELYPAAAPGAVSNFEGLANGKISWLDPKSRQTQRKPFYDGLTFHRVIPNFMIQGGCPIGNGTGGPGFTIKCETKNNPYKHERGSLSMAHAGKDTGGSQFFICHSPQSHLNGVHTVFGKLVDGFDVLDAIKGGDVIVSIRVVEE